MGRGYTVCDYDDSVAFIPATNGQFAVVDADDAKSLSKHNWQAGWYENTGSYYIQNRSGKMHRIVVGAGDGDIVDHINGNTFDNRKSNLRIVDYTQNARNRKNSGAGVYYRKDRNKWRAGVCVGGRQVWLGSYNDKSQAVAAAAYGRCVAHKGYTRAAMPSIKEIPETAKRALRRAGIEPQ